MGSHSFLQRIFPTQRSNPGLPHCRWILYQLSHQGSPLRGGTGLQIWEGWKAEPPLWREKDLVSSETSCSFIKKAPGQLKEFQTQYRFGVLQICDRRCPWWMIFNRVKVLAMTNDFLWWGGNFAPKVRQFLETLSVVRSSGKPEGCFWHLVGREQGWCKTPISAEGPSLTAENDPAHVSVELRLRNTGFGVN